MCKEPSDMALYPNSGMIGNKLSKIQSSVTIADTEKVDSELLDWRYDICGWTTILTYQYQSNGSC